MPAPSLNSWPARHWADVSTRDFAAAQASGLAARTVAVLPVAAVEQHGPHLPLSVDATLLQGVVPPRCRSCRPTCLCFFCRRKPSG